VAGDANALEPPDFHAYLEAYLDRRWYIFDPTRLAPQTGLIRIGAGRDAADTSFATIFGPVVLESMKVTMQRIHGSIPDHTTDAISTSPDSA
jgi:transglutaminase-like putative cysteine protease